tara:strand:+ start:17579 stop:18973 length:1395 start_codon:yes stop_codon:yes gene_type:complete
VILCVFCFFIISHKDYSQNTFVPDDNFEQALIDLGYDSGALNDLVPTANINTITNLDVNTKNILDLTGIEDFLGLQTLNCQNNQLTSLDVSKNIGLTQLFCGNNNLSGIDVSMLLDLQIFWCQNNQLSNINITTNTKLISLVCGANQLTSLDVSNNKVLNVLSIENNLINTIDVANNSTLNFFNCANNLLTSVDVTNNGNLSHFDCNTNQITSLDTSNNTILDFLNVAFNDLILLDLSQNPILTTINSSNNNLCELNIRNGNNNNVLAFNFTNNPNLNCVVVDNPSGDHSTWAPIAFSNYVSSQTDCSAFVIVDSLNDVIVTRYTLPALTYGSYYSASGGNGIPLSAGDVITTSQTIYIYAQTACNSNESEFNVLISNKSYFIPRFFTPNNDGSHDYWSVVDITNSIKTISIYNRNGKLLKSLPPNSIGWNGTFNGKPLESNDYWYVIILNSGERLNGHFTLKR